MRDDTTPPAWLTEYISLWMGRLGVQDWHVHVAVATRIVEYPKADGLCETYPEINRADLSFLVGIEDCAEDRIKVIHELLHVLHGRIDSTVERVVLPAIPEAAQEMAASAYRLVYESYIHQLAVSLWRLAEGEEEGNDAP